MCGVTLEGSETTITVITVVSLVTSSVVETWVAIALAGTADTDAVEAD